MILSEVINRGSASKVVTYRICSLDMETALDFPWPGGMCFGYSATDRLEPNDTVRGYHKGVVKSAPGEYTLRIRHLLDPELWAQVSIVVE